MPLTQYAGVGLLPSQGSTTEATKISTYALLAVEGPIDDTRRDKVFTAEELERMAQSTNEYLSSGRKTNLYLSEHSARSGDFVGVLNQGLYTKEIGEDDLPEPGMQELVGKIGLFGPVDITVQRGIEVYNGGLRTISIGHDEDGSFLGKDVIGEISITSFPAIYGASLYSKTFTPTTTSAGNLLLKGLSDEDKKAIATYGLTIAQTTAEETQVDAADEAWEAFHRMNRTIRDIQEADEVSLQGNSRELLIEQAIATTADSFRSLYLPLPPEPVLPPLPSSTFTKERPMDPEGTNLDTADKQPDLSTYQKQVDDLTANNVKLADELNQMKMRQSVSAQYTRLRNKGESLIRQYKLSPAQFKATFGDDAEADIDKFLNPPEGEGGKYNLSNVEYHLSQVEQYGQAIAPTADAGEPEEIADPAQDQYDTELQTYRRKRGYVTKEAN